jgi:hypothetical protein
MAKSKSGKLRPPTATRETVNVGAETPTPSLRAEKISIPTAIFLGAFGPLKIIEELRPSYARRYGRWLSELSMAYSEHEVQDGTEAALDWLIKQVFDPTLPDLRRGKSASEDWTLNDKLGRLKTALAPVFRETNGDPPRTRLARIEPIVSEVLGRPWKPTHAMTGKEPLMAFCYDVLGVSAARASQARARWWRATDKMLKRMIARANMRRAAGLPAGDSPGPIAQVWRLLGMGPDGSSKRETARAKK